MAAISPLQNLNCAFSISALFSASGAAALLGTPSVNNISAGVNQTFQNTTAGGAILNATQAKYYTTTIAASGNSIQDYSAASANLLGQVTATFGTGLTGLFWFLPTPAQAPVLGLTVQATSVTIGNTAATQFLGFFGTAGSEATMVPGDIVGGARTGPTASPWSITSLLKSMLYLNNDSVNAANIITFLIGS